MLEQLLDVIKNNADDLVVKNNAIPNQYNAAVMKDAADITKTELAKAAASGNMQDILNMFSQKGSNQNGLTQNPIVKSIISNLMEKLTSSYGVSAGNAQGIASSLIPMVLSHFSKKVNNPQDKSIDIDSVMGSLTGGKIKGTDFGSLLSQINNGKSVDFEGLIGQVLGGGSTKKGGSILGGLFKRLTRK